MKSILSLLVAGTLCFSAAAQPVARTKHLIIITIDGFRWQEVFTGADPLLVANPDYVRDTALTRGMYWDSTAELRRQKLLPFFWGTLATKGRLYGNRLWGNKVNVRNFYKISYPGYNEMSVGFPNPDITSNEFGPNPNASVFEWLNKSPDLSGRVAIYGTWRTYVDIFNEPRSHLAMQAGWATAPRTNDAARDTLLARLFDTTTRFDEEDVGNSFLQVELLDYVRTGKPRVLFVGYGETDNWAHQGRYDLVLESAHRTDGFVKELWDTLQAMPQYHGTTTFIITADHGRGSGPVEWKDHGVHQKGSENVWIAVIGPDTPALGERTNIAPVMQAQIAATVAALIGKDYRKDVPRAAPAIADVLKGP